ncbi:MAG: M23 family metallopeptidase [Patescibacteria group bacterium]
MFIPLKIAGNLILKAIFVPIYKIYLKLKSKTKKITAKTGTLNNFLFNKNTIHIFIILITCLTILDNFNTHSVLAEDLGKGSIIFELAQGDEFSEITEQAIQPIAGDNTDKSALEKFINKNKNTEETATSTPTTTQGSIFEYTLTRNTQILSPDLAEDKSFEKENSILSDAILKTSSPETEEVPKPREAIVEYTVENGDTISTIASQFGISINTILWENKISGLSIIRPGDTLTILPISGVSHTVQKNETLSSIAKKYSSEVEELLSYNKLVSDKQLQIGQKLIVPGGSVTPPTRSVRNVTSIFTSAPSVGSPSSRIGGFIWPTVSTHITQYYNWQHHAIDIGSPLGLPIYASMAGKVTVSGWGTGYGNYVVIDHGGGKRTLYGHMSKIYVNKGQEVNQGTAIGAIGSTGWSTGPHLHFEIIINGSKVNPLSYL